MPPRSAGLENTHPKGKCHDDQSKGGGDQHERADELQQTRWYKAPLESDRKWASEANPMCKKRQRRSGRRGKGEIATNPEVIDVIVKRAWGVTYDGIVDCIETVIETFFEKLEKQIPKQKEYNVPKIDGDMVYDSFSRRVESAGPSDGWNPKELSLASRRICEKVPDVFNQIAVAASWPRSSMHARLVYLEKEGAKVGEVMSYRPLAIIAPLYRRWATMRLASQEEWIGLWALGEMYAGILEMGPLMLGAKPSPR